MHLNSNGKNLRIRSRKACSGEVFIFINSFSSRHCTFVLIDKEIDVKGRGGLVG